MSVIKSIARELYALQREVDRLERLLNHGSYSPQQKDSLVLELNKAVAMRDQLKSMLEGHKDPPTYKKAK